MKSEDYKRMKEAKGIIGIYQEKKKLQEHLDELKQYLMLLNKYTGAQETIDSTNFDIEMIKEEIEKLEKNIFFCPECGAKLKREERIYRHLSGMAGEGTPYYVMWDTYICNNCGYFTWDEESSQYLGEMSFNLPYDDPRYHGTMDGHPRFDEDHKKYIERKVLKDDEDENKTIC